MVLVLLLFNLYYVDQPYAIIPNHGIFDMQLRFGPEGGILGSFSIGIWDRLSLGISYGASNLIGAGDPEFYEQPGVQIRILAVQEEILTPTVILGFDNQGFGAFDQESRRYAIMSKGLYCQTGKSFEFSGMKITPSLGINYALEQEHRFDMFMGLEALFGSTTALLFEYSPNFGDPLDQNKGYMNCALRFIFYEQLFFEFAVRDLLDNSIYDQQLNRVIKLGYEQGF